jgi:Xaa-Pro aminopeptidase
MAVSIPATGPRISLAERDRRHAAVRAELKARGLDCLIVGGSDLTYLCNGLPGQLFGVLPTEPEPMTVQIMGRFLVDVPVEVLLEAQDWVTDIRSSNASGPVIDRLRELRLEHGKIGVTRTRSAFGGLSTGFLENLRTAFPEAQFVDVTDILANLRAIKSAEEIAMIDRANLLFDLAVEHVHQVARPGMRGAVVVAEAVKRMVEAGADVSSMVGLNFGPIAAENPILWELCLDREIQPGDMATMSAHTEYHHYGGHSDQEISFGEPKPLYREMFDAVLYVRDAVLQQMRPGNTYGEVISTYRKACLETGFRWSEHSQIHQYGIDVPESPGPAFNAEGPSERGGQNYVLTPGMVYSVSPTIVAKDGEDRILGGTCLVITEDGYRELGDRKVEMLISSGA